MSRYIIQKYFYYLLQYRNYGYIGNIFRKSILKLIYGLNQF